MRVRDPHQACADCGDVFPITAHVRLLLDFTCARPLCATCLRSDRQPVKKAAEIWLLEEMYARGDKLRMAVATLRHVRGAA